MFQQQSANILCENFPDIFFPWCKIPGGTFPHVGRSLRPCLEGTVSSGNVKNEPSMTYCTVQSGVRLASPQKVSCVFRLLHFQGNLDKPL
jgi:hypothetical protein